MSEHSIRSGTRKIADLPADRIPVFLGYWAATNVCWVEFMDEGPVEWLEFGDPMIDCILNALDGDGATLQEHGKLPKPLNS